MVGVYFPSPRQRLELLEEGIELIKVLWSGEPSDFNGRNYNLRDAEMHPEPASLMFPLT